MDLSDDRRPPRRPLFFPVAIAAVFLAVIGMSAGLVLGAQAKQKATRAAAEQTLPPPTAVQTGPPCRPETEAQARLVDATGALHLRLLLRTATSAVWICSDETGRLYYHANRGGEAAVWVEGKTALFLTDVTADGDVYTAVAQDGDGRRTTFRVSQDRLVIVHKDGTEEEQPAVP